MKKLLVILGLMSFLGGCMLIDKHRLEDIDADQPTEDWARQESAPSEDTIYLSTQTMRDDRSVLVFTEDYR